MIRDTSRLEKHLENNPSDAQSVISLIKIRSENYQYTFNLEAKRKQERMNALRRGKD